mgnify:CR=1 FL=1
MYMKSISFNNNGQKCLFMEIKSGYHVKSKEEKLIEKEIVIYTFQYNVWIVIFLMKMVKLVMFISGRLMW